MNPLAALLALAAACLVTLVVYELRSQETAPAYPVVSPSQPAAGAPPAPIEPALAVLADTLLARPLFSQTRRPPNAASPAATPAASASALPRMTAILIDGPRRSAIFASRPGRPTIVAEGGRIGPFTIQTIEPEQVIVVGPDGKRTVRTSFDPTLQPPAAPPPYGLGAPQFPGIAVPGIAVPGIAVPGIAVPGIAPAIAVPGGLPQPAGAAR